MLGKLPFAQILEPLDLAFVIAELRHGQVKASVAIQVARAHVRHAVRACQNNVRRELLTSVVFKYHHRTRPFVARWYNPHGADEQVDVAVSIKIHRFNMSGARDQIAYRLLNELSGGNLANPHDPVHARVAADHIFESITVEIDDCQIGDPSRLIGPGDRPNRARDQVSHFQYCAGFGCRLRNRSAQQRGKCEHHYSAYDPTTGSGSPNVTRGGTRDPMSVRLLASRTRAPDSARQRGAHTRHEPLSCAHLHSRLTWIVRVESGFQR
jgi:hypothetical protein